MSNKNIINNKKDILLLLLYSPGVTEQINESIKGRTRILKILFIFKKEVLKYFKKNTDINDDNFYEYFPWNFGPFSSQVYDDITFFLLRGFIVTRYTNEEALPEAASEERHWQFISGIQSSSIQEGYQEFTEEEFLLTNKGKEFTKDNLYNYLSSSQKDLLRNFKSKLNSASLRAILHYVYKKYPEMSQNSQIKPSIVGH